MAVIMRFSHVHITCLDHIKEDISQVDVIDLNYLCMF